MGAGRWIIAAGVGAALAWGVAGTTAWALPQTLVGSGQERGASVTLRLDAQTIEGDARSRCELEFEVTDDDIPFTLGDTIQISVYEDDLVGDELLFQETLPVIAQEVDAGVIRRAVNCSSDFGDDGDDRLEIFAELTAVKDDCGTFCSYERATTTTLSVEVAGDDPNEPDNTEAQATSLPLLRDDTTGVLEAQEPNLVCRDEDWFAFQVDQTGRAEVEIFSDSSGGLLDAVLFTSDGRRLAESQPTEFGPFIAAGDLPSGDYALRVSPASRMDYNFYALSVRVDDAECEPGAEEEGSCGNCGVRQRVCGEDRRWTPFGPCAGEGECRPNDQRQTACGDCGSVTEACSELCVWEAQGFCEGEGECSRGDQELEVCDEGARVRTCLNDCAWGEYGPCQGDECETGDVRTCYTGPASTEGVGVCAEGRQLCNLGRWGACEGEATPGAEACDDGRDNDCDGSADASDEDCARSLAPLGEACEASSGCADGLLCLRAPEHPQFEGGHCGDDCRSDADCGDEGACAAFLGGQFCLKRCARESDCRLGYVCAELGAAGSLCAPRCDADADCGGVGTCDLRAGVCAEGQPNNADANNADANNADTNNDANNDANNGGAASGGGSDEGGCAVGRGPQGLVSLAWGLLGALLLRRVRGSTTGRSSTRG
jgi:hypothetical protein